MKNKEFNYENKWWPLTLKDETIFNNKWYYRTKSRGFKIKKCCEPTVWGKSCHVVTGSWEVLFARFTSHFITFCSRRLRPKKLKLITIRDSKADQQPDSMRQFLCFQVSVGMPEDNSLNNQPGDREHLNWGLELKSLNGKFWVVPSENPFKEKLWSWHS